MILVVDDEAEWRDYYERLFGEFEVEGFSDGVAAMKRMAEVVPEVVILDVLLTGPDGFALLHEMQSDEELARVPVVVVSSAGVGGDLGEYGVVRVFDKGTMRPAEVREEIKKRCRPIRLQGEYSISGVKSQDG